jgi:hypothetical protein
MSRIVIVMIILRVSNGTKLNIVTFYNVQEKLHNKSRANLVNEENQTTSDIDLHKRMGTKKCLSF